MVHANDLSIALIESEQELFNMLLVVDASFMMIASG
jgi:hypothetical protein